MDCCGNDKGASNYTGDSAFQCTSSLCLFRSFLAQIYFSVCPQNVALRVFHTALLGEARFCSATPTHLHHSGFDVVIVLSLCCISKTLIWQISDLSFRASRQKKKTKKKMESQFKPSPNLEMWFGYDLHFMCFCCFLLSRFYQICLDTIWIRYSLLWANW